MAATKPATLPEDPSCQLRMLATNQGTTKTIELDGEWDLAQRDAVDAAVTRALDHRPEHLVLDLSRLDFIDSSGIQGVIEIQRRSAAQGTSLVLISGPPAVQRVFEICGLMGELPFADGAQTPRGELRRPSRG